MTSPAASEPRPPSSTRRTIGGYRVQRRLGFGGMGEVYLAVAAGLEGVERPVAIKLIRHLHQQRPDFIEMFIEEAKVSFLLTHPNIVQTHEIGEVDGHYFLVMEYVDGTNLEELLHFFDARVGQPLPAAYGLYIGAQVARGLEYAHTLRDRRGNPLNIVHRDVSPGNVLLSRDGQVKVTDFGLAKSELRKVESQAGQIKGKLAYMAPEQFRGRSVDGRADVYSLGLVLYEALSGRHPFGEHDKITLETRVRELAIPPLAGVAPHLDPPLVALVERCIAEDPSRRFGSARELGRELDRCARELGLTVSDYELAEFIARARGEAEARPVAPHPFDQALGMELRKVDAEAPGVSAFVRVPTEEDEEAREEAAPQPTTQPPVAPRRWWPLTLVLLLVAIGVGAAGAYLARRGEEAVAVGPRPDARGAVADARPAPPVAPRRATLHVRPDPPGGRVLVAGLGRGTAPVSISGLPAGTVRVQIELAGREPYDQQITLEPGAELTLQPRLARIRPAARPRKRRLTGTLSVNSDPWAVVHVDGARIKSTPLVRHRLPVGKHVVLLVNPVRKLRARRTVLIRADRETQLSVELDKR
jgi:hypothetical protein